MGVDNRARKVLWYVTFFGFAINYMTRVNINIAIVAMVQVRPVKAGQLQPECYIRHLANTTLNNATDELPEGFPWDERQQGMALGSYFWLHWLSQLPGGILSQNYGGKKVYGWSQLFCVLTCFLMPVSAHYNISAFVFLKFLQGLVAGCVWPAMQTMTGKWIPPNERSNFVTAYLGSSVGAAVAYPFYGILIDWFGWESVFYISGALGVIWYLAWHFLAFDSPSVHPGISQEEKEYILKSLNQNSRPKKLSTPWIAILLSFPLWINILAQFANLWGVFMILTQAPTYLRLIHGWTVKATGLLSGLPHVARIIGGFIFSSSADYLLRKNKLSRTNVRKLCTSFCTIGQGVFVLGVAVSGCNSTAAVVCIILAAGMQGAISGGPLASFVDLAPNFAGILHGINGTITSLPGFITPAIVGALTFNNQTTGQWQTIFLISAVVSSLGGAIFALFGKAEIQWWNSENEDTGKVLQPLKSNTDS